MPPSKQKIDGVVVSRQTVSRASHPQAYISPPRAHVSFLEAISPELFLMIVYAVWYTAGSAGLIAMAGVCSKWRQIVFSAGLPLAESRRLFSTFDADRHQLSVGIIPIHRFIDNGTSIVLNKRLHAELFTPGAWPPASLTPKAVATGLITVFGKALAFAVADLDAETARLEALGTPCIARSRTADVRYFDTRAQGNILLRLEAEGDAAAT